MEALAKKSAEGRFIGPEPFCGYNCSSFRERLLTWKSKGKEDHWNTLPETSQSRKLIRYSKERTKKFLELSKPELRRITGLLTRHCTLRHHLKKMGKTTNDASRLCFKEKETAKHVLCENILGKAS